MANGTTDNLESARVGHTPTAMVIGRSFSFRMASQIVSALINVAAMVLLVNHLSAQGYGQYAFYYALIPLIACLSDLGTSVIFTREVAQDREAGPRALGDALVIKGVVSGALLLVAVVTSTILLPPPQALLVSLVTATALIDIGQDAGISILRGHDRQDLEAVLLIVSQVAWFAGIAMFTRLGAPLPFLLGAATVAFILRFAVGMFLVARLLYRPVFVLDWNRLKGIAMAGLPFGLAMFTVVLYGRIGILLLKGFSSDADVGYFNMGYMLSQPLGFIGSGLTISAFPTLARLVSQGPRRVGSALRRLVKFQLLAALPISVGLFLLADPVLRLLFHVDSVRQAGIALKFVSLGLGLIFLNLMCRYVLAALDEQSSYLRAMVLGLLVNVVLSAALIHWMGFAGACLGLIAGELTVLAICMGALREYVQPLDFLRELGRPLLAAAGMGIVVFLLREANLIFVTLAGAAVYGALVLLLRILSSDEVRALRHLYISMRLPGSARLMRAESRA
jgi:O-antigen/teichoic acid export membrane protein